MSVQMSVHPSGGSDAGVLMPMPTAAHDCAVKSDLEFFPQAGAMFSIVQLADPADLLGTHFAGGVFQCGEPIDSQQSRSMLMLTC